MKTALEMEVEELGKGEEGNKGTQRALGALELLTQEAEPSGTTLVRARNGFNELSLLAMLWTVLHLWPEGVRYTFNCYRHGAKILLRQTGSHQLQS